MQSIYLLTLKNQAIQNHFGKLDYSQGFQKLLPPLEASDSKETKNLPFPRRFAMGKFYPALNQAWVALVNDKFHNNFNVLVAPTFHRGTGDFGLDILKRFIHLKSANATRDRASTHLERIGQIGLGTDYTEVLHNLNPDFLKGAISQMLKEKQPK